jgi:hypothetical protein
MTKIFEDYLAFLDRKLNTRIRKSLLLIDQCAAHPKNIIFLNIKIVFSQLTISAS